MAKKKVSLEELSRDIKNLFNVINNEKDLSVVLISTSYIDICLTTILSNHFKKSRIVKEILDPNKGFLGSYSNKLKIAYCLDLLNKSVFNNLNTIGEIRNKFAHSYIEIDFYDDEAKELCGKLDYFSHVVNKNGQAIKENGYESIFKSKDPRTRFIITVSILVNMLIVQNIDKEKDNV